MSLLINNFGCSWGHLTLTAGKVRQRGVFTALEYSDAIEEAMGRPLGLSQAPEVRSLGVYNPSDCKLTGVADKVDELLNQLALQSPEPGNVSLVEFVITATFALRPTSPVRTIVLERCRVIGINDSYAEGPDLLATELTIKPMRISRGNVRLFSMVS